MGHDPTRGSGQGFQNLAGRVGSGNYVLKYHGPGQVGSRVFKISRVGSDRVNRASKSRGSGRVGSGRVGSRGFKISRVESGRVKSFLKSRGSGRVMTRELFLGDSRVEHADLACGFAFFKHIAACRRVLVVPAPCGIPPGPKMIQNVPLPA